jgi:hypothetical protein
MAFVTERARFPAAQACARRCERHFAPGSSSVRRASGAAWLLPIARVQVLVLCPRACARGGDWERSCRPCPRTYPFSERDQSRGPSLRRRCSSPPSTVLRPPRTPAAHDVTSPSAYTRRLAPTRAAQTGLSCSSSSLEHVLRPIPRQDSRRVLLRTSAPRAWPSPRHARLGSRIVSVSRRQASLDVAARALAPSEKALDAPLRPRRSLAAPGACYRTVRFLSARDLHPLVR